MKKLKNKAFTLVELLVVITILAIISVVAYQNFGGAVDKAVSGRKISDVSTIETSLSQYKVDNGSYPKADIYDATTNLWGYDNLQDADPSNQIKVIYNGEAINSLVTADSTGGGIVYGTGTWAKGAASETQIGAKGTISQNNLTKKYLTKDLYDPEVGDLKIETTSNKMIDYGIGRYVYATFKKSPNWPNNQSGNAYNIAYTIKETNSDKYITKIVGDYDENSCYDDSANCPTTLIGLNDGEEQSLKNNSSTDNYGVPYAVTDFAE
ncbi:MAG: type II secretion system protein [Candidatus Gracilibacteria bacterium]|nr:type II secretion system protein [Candidatus Gracilibacteria bacterium]